MGTALPHALRTALGALSDNRSGRDIALSAARMSRTYRARGNSAGLSTPSDIAAYANARLPATFAATGAALEALRRAAPDLRPGSLLDLGCGPGSATFAALECFPDIRSVHLVDRNPALLDAAGRLFDAAGYGLGRTLQATLADMRDAPVPCADLVLVSYALVELDTDAAVRLVRRLHAEAGQMLVLVEPGSQDGFGRIRAARETLIAAGARIAAPCTHAAACPIASPDWCHFSVRLARSRDHLRAKSAVVPFEDEKFTYLVALPGGTSGRTEERIVAPPKRTKSGINLRCCGPDGLTNRCIQSRDMRFRTARKLEWGDIYAPQPGHNQE